MSVQFDPAQGQIISSLSQRGGVSGAPYGMSDTVAQNLGVSLNNPVVSRLVNAATVGALPILVEAATTVPTGLAPRHLLTGTSNALGAASHLIRSAQEFYNGQRPEGMLHAAQATSQAYSAIVSGLVIGGMYFMPDLQLIEIGVAVAAPRIARGLYEKVSEAPNGLIASAFGIERPYILRINNYGSPLEFPITADEKQKLENGTFKHYSVVRNAGNNGYEIKFLSDAAPIAPAPRRAAAPIIAPASRRAAAAAAPRKRASPAPRRRRASPASAVASGAAAPPMVAPPGAVGKRSSSRARRSPVRL